MFVKILKCMKIPQFIYNFVAIEWAFLWYPHKRWPSNNIVALQTTQFYYLWQIVRVLHSAQLKLKNKVKLNYNQKSFQFNIPNLSNARRINQWNTDSRNPRVYSSSAKMHARDKRDREVKGKKELDWVDSTVRHWVHDWTFGPSRPILVEFQQRGTRLVLGTNTVLRVSAFNRAVHADSNVQACTCTRGGSVAVGNGISR